MMTFKGQKKKKKIICIQVPSMSFHNLMAHFFSLMSNIPLYGFT